MMHSSIFPHNNLYLWELGSPSDLKMLLDLPLKFPLFGRLHIKELRPKFINVFELGPTTCG
jgi:hypothetical protein